MFFKKKINKQIDREKLPVHIAIIMDGNGRWAKKRALPRTAGHQVGANTLETVVKYANKLGVKYITAYAFSTENWKRPKEEVDFLMNLLLDYLQNAEKNLAGENIVIRVIGSREGLSDEMCRQIDNTEELTRNNTGLVLNIALNYGSREEILTAVKSIASDVKDGKLSIDDINDSELESRLHTAECPEPDLLIRTSGELRISNFLLWQISYSELYFTDKLWPDFGIPEFEKAILEFQSRNRRFGAV